MAKIIFTSRYMRDAPAAQLEIMCAILLPSRGQRRLMRAREIFRQQRISRNSSDN